MCKGSLGLVWGVMDRETLDQLLRAELLALLAQQAEVIRRQRSPLFASRRGSFPQHAGPIIKINVLLYIVPRKDCLGT